MKRFIALISLLIILIAGCTFQPSEKTAIDDTLGSNTAGTNIVNVAGSDGQIFDTDWSTTDIEGIIYIGVDKILPSDITFNTRTDTETMQSGTDVEIIEEVASINVTSAAMEYQKEFERIRLSGEFEDDGAFTLHFVADNFQSANGDFLDGNGNGINDGSPYDDVYYRYFTGAGAGDRPDLTHPTMQDFGPVEGRIAKTDHITIDFSERMDSSSVVENVTLYDDNDNECDISLVSISGANVFTFEMDTNDIDQLSMYTVTLDCADMEDENNNVLVPYNEYYSENMSTTFSFKFMTEADGSADDNPVRYSWGTPVPTVNPTYLDIYFTDYIDPTTITSDNIDVLYLDNSTGEWINLKGEIIVNDYDSGFHFSLMNLQDANANLQVILKHSIKDEDGWYLDGNNNDIGGEDYDPDRKGYESSDNQVIFF